MKNPRILCIDDERIRLFSLSELLKSRGYTVITAGNADLGMELFLANDSLDLVVTDYFMPNKNGAMLAFDMKRAKPWVQILLISGALTMPEFVLALVDGFHSSSDEPEQLLHKVDELLGRTTAASGAA